MGQVCLSGRVVEKCCRGRRVDRSETVKAINHLHMLIGLNTCRYPHSGSEIGRESASVDGWDTIEGACGRPTEREESRVVIDTKRMKLSVKILRCESS